MCCILIVNMIMHIHHYDLYGHALAQESLPALTWPKYCRYGVQLYPINQSIKNSCPGGHKIDKFSRPFIGRHYYILSSSNLYRGVEIFKEIYFHYLTYMATPWHKNPSRGSKDLQF